MMYPFPGLSTMVHIVVICMKAVSDGFKGLYKKIRNLLNQKNSVKIFSTGIILLILSFVLASSWYIIFLGLTSNKSNIKVIRHLIMTNSHMVSYTKIDKEILTIIQGK